MQFYQFMSFKVQSPSVQSLRRQPASAAATAASSFNRTGPHIWVSLHSAIHTTVFFTFCQSVMLVLGFEFTVPSNSTRLCNSSPFVVSLGWYGVDSPKYCTASISSNDDSVLSLSDCSITLRKSVRFPMNKVLRKSDKRKVVQKWQVSLFKNIFTSNQKPDADASCN